MAMVQQFISTLQAREAEAIGFKQEGNLLLACSCYERIVKHVGDYLTYELLSPKEEEFILFHFAGLLASYGMCLFAAGNLPQAYKAFGFVSRCLEHTEHENRLLYLFMAELCTLGVNPQYAEELFSAKFLRNNSVASLLENVKIGIMKGGTYDGIDVKRDDFNDIQLPLFDHILKLNQLPKGSTIPLNDFLLYSSIRRLQSTPTPPVSTPIKYWAKIYGIVDWLGWQDW